MAQKTQQNTQDAPQTTAEAPQSANEDLSSIRSGQSLFSLARGSEGRTMQHKVAFMGDIRQKLAEVADTSKKLGEESKEAESLAAASATRLFAARRDAIVSADELTGLLGDIFGYKPKADGTPGKTPAGVGEAMRKRIVRCLQGWDFVNGGEGGRFYETMSADDVEPVINSIGRTKEVNGEVIADGPTVWSAYKLLGDIKSKGTVRVERAFDPKFVLSLVDKLSEAGARDKLINNRPLVKAYAGLFDQLAILAQVDDNEAEAIKARLDGAASVEAETETETTNEGGEELAA